MLLQRDPERVHASAAFEAGADDLITLPAAAGQLAFALEKALARRRGASRRRGRGRADPRARAEGRDRQDADSCNLAVALARAGASAVDRRPRPAVRRRRARARARAGADDLRPRASRAARSTREKVDGYLAEHPSGARALLAPMRPDQAGGDHGRRSCARSSDPARDATTSSIVDTPPAFTPEVIAAIDDVVRTSAWSACSTRSRSRTRSSGSRRSTQMGYDAPSDHARAQPRRHERRASRTTTSRRCSGGGPTSSSRATARSRARSPRASRSSSPSPRSDAAQAFAALAERYVDGTARSGDAPTASPTNGSRRRCSREGGADHGAPRATLGQRRRGGVGATARPVRRAQEPHPPRARQRARPAAVRRRATATPIRERGRGRDPRRSSAQEAGALAGRPRAARRRDRRRHLRLRPARAAARRRLDLGDHGQRPARHLDRAPRPALRDDAALHATTRTCAGSSTRWSARSAGASTSRRRWSTRACPTARRVNAIIPPLSLSGPLLTIRKFDAGAVRPRRARRDSARSPQRAADFLSRCIEAELNILISGGTGTGKTTLLNALSAAVPDARPDRHDRGRGRAPARRSSTSCGSSRARRTSRARARSRSASSCATRCACGPTGSSSARFAAPRRSTCSRR